VGISQHGLGGESSDGPAWSARASRSDSPTVALQPGGQDPAHGPDGPGTPRLPIKHSKSLRGYCLATTGRQPEGRKGSSRYSSGTAARPALQHLVPTRPQSVTLQGPRPESRCQMLVGETGPAEQARFASASGVRAPSLHNVARLPGSSRICRRRPLPGRREVLDRPCAPGLGVLVFHESDRACVALFRAEVQRERGLQIEWQH
jgi:hypothetical protein